MGFPTLNDAARRVATVFEKWNCVIESCLPAERERPQKIEPYRPFAAVSLLEYGGLKPILPFHGVRSDAACRVVIRLRAASIDHRISLQDSRIGWRYAQWHTRASVHVSRRRYPAMPTVGAGSSQREDSLAHRPRMLRFFTPQIAHAAALSASCGWE